MRKYILSILVLFTLHGAVKSQHSLSIEHIFIPDTVQFGSILGITLDVVNVGQDTIFWPIDIQLSINSVEIEPLYQIDFGDDSFLSPGESGNAPWPVIDSSTSSVVGAFIMVVPELSFMAGDNIIVVWPTINHPDFVSGQNILEIDQFIKEVYVTDSPTNLFEDREVNKTFVSFNKNDLLIHANEDFDYYELFNLIGKRVSHGYSKRVEISSLTSGLYLLGLHHKNGKREVVKLYLP